MTSNSSHDFLSIFFGGKYDLIQLQGIKLYIKMVGITFSPQNYHHQQFLSKLRENNENYLYDFSCLGCYCFRPMCMAALSLSPLRPTGGYTTLSHHFEPS